MPPQKNYNINTAQKSKKVRIEINNFLARLVQFKDQKRAKNILNS